MRGGTNRLSARAVESLKTTGIFTDGGGLYLRVKSATSKSWIFVWHIAGRRRELGLGSARDVSLARARDRAREARDLVAEGRDPAAIKKVTHALPTFGDVADQFIALRSDLPPKKWTGLSRSALGLGWADVAQG